jgi:hypothetical protein
VTNLRGLPLEMGKFCRWRGWACLPVSMARNQTESTRASKLYLLRIVAWAGLAGLVWRHSCNRLERAALKFRQGSADVYIVVAG